MKKNAFIEKPVPGLKRLSFPKRGLQVFTKSADGNLPLELALEEKAFLPSLGGGIGISIIADGLRTLQVHGQCLHVLTFHPAEVSLDVSREKITFKKILAGGKLTTIFEQPFLDASPYFIVAHRKRRTEVWFLLADSTSPC